MAKKFNLRSAVLAELKRQKKSRYWLVQQLAGEIPATTIYEWLAGKHDIPVDKAMKILNVLTALVIRLDMSKAVTGSSI
jgi:hypothetical protein